MSEGNKHEKAALKEVSEEVAVDEMTVDNAAVLTDISAEGAPAFVAGRPELTVAGDTIELSPADLTPSTEVTQADVSLVG